MRVLQLQGQKFGKLLVIDKSFDETKKKESRWNCLCDCGNKTIATGWHLKANKVNSCGCLYLKNDRKGHVYGYWKVLEYAGNEKWKCQCKCGLIKDVSSGTLYMGTSKSCGCLQRPEKKEYDERKKQNILQNKTINENGCWEWSLYKNDRGYGNSSYRSYPMRVNRLVWKLWKGEIPENLYVCHTCDNPKCCNPDHLFLGSHQDNMNDMALKGRACKGEKCPLHSKNRGKYVQRTNE